MKLLEFRPNRSYLDSNFNGYKLSLEKIPILRKALAVSVDHVLPSNDQYSFSHHKLFSLHNHLTGEDLDDDGCIYFVDKNQHIQKAVLDDVANEIVLRKVWEIPEFRQHQTGDYNFSMKLFNKNLAVVSNGAGILYVVKTDLDNSKMWQCLFYDEVLGPGMQFIIQDVAYNEKTLHCLLLCIEQNELTKKYFSALHWVTLSQVEDESWGEVALRKLISKGDLYYAHFESNCNAIYTVSDNGCVFTMDSENPIKEVSQSNDKNLNYMWTQTDENVNLVFQLPENFKKDDLNIKVECEDIEVVYQNQIFIKGKLTHLINKELTTWEIEDHRLNVVLRKQENGLMWLEVIEDNYSQTEHQQVLNSSSNENMVKNPPEGQSLIFSRQQIEECDFEDDKLTFFERLDCVSHQVTHRANLGCHHVLLTAKLSQDLPPAMAIRYDVDACLWQPLLNNDDFSLSHEATLLAFGYIQASKQQKKFCSCAPDMGYSVICDSSRHVFIYRQKKSIGNAELRNRTTGRNVGTIAQQQVVNVSDEEILGLFAANNVLFLLTENTVIALKL